MRNWACSPPCTIIHATPQMQPPVPCSQACKIPHTKLVCSTYAMRHTKSQCKLPPCNWACNTHCATLLAVLDATRHAKPCARLLMQTPMYKPPPAPPPCNHACKPLPASPLLQSGVQIPTCKTVPGASSTCKTPLAAHPSVTGHTNAHLQPPPPYNRGYNRPPWRQAAAANPPPATHLVSIPRKPPRTAHPSAMGHANPHLQPTRGHTTGHAPPPPQHRAASRPQPPPHASRRAKHRLKYPPPAAAAAQPSLLQPTRAKPHA